MIEYSIFLGLYTSVPSLEHNVVAIEEAVVVDSCVGAAYDFIEFRL
jgi:hypothetical protein